MTATTMQRARLFSDADSETGRMPMDPAFCVSFVRPLFRYACDFFGVPSGVVYPRGIASTEFFHVNKTMA